MPRPERGLLLHREPLACVVLASLSTSIIANEDTIVRTAVVRSVS
jgi:hypothetical protein